MLESALGIIVFVAVGFAASSQVLELTDGTFENSLSQHDVVLVMFKVKICGWCKKFKPAMDWAAKSLAGTYNVKLFVVDCQENVKICQRYSITGYPTLKVFKTGKYWKEYDGGQTGESVKRYMIEHAMPCPVVLDAEEKLRQVTSDGNVYVAFFRKGSADSLKTIFLQTAEELRGHQRMGFSENPKMISKYHPEQGVVFFRDQRMRNKFEPDTIPYAGNDTKTTLEDWMAKVKHGLVGVRSPENVREFKTPLVVAYYDVDMVYNVKHTNYWRNKILKVAKKFKKFTFAISDKSQFEDDLFQFGYNHFPHTVKEPIVLARTKNHKFKMSGEFTVENLKEFVEGIKIEKLPPFVRSETPPEKNDRVVKIVVADTFEQLVVNSGRDSFIMLYATDSEISKKPRRLWSKIGQAMDGEDVDIMKMDVGKNDRPSKYKLIGEPVVYFVPKDDKNTPVRYTGRMDYRELIEFVAKSATVELKARDRKGNYRKDEL